MADDGAADATSSSDTLTVRVKDQTGEETYFKVKNTTKMGKVFQAYAKRKGLAVGSLRFLLDGERINEDESPKSVSCVCVCPSRLETICC